MSGIGTFPQDILYKIISFLKDIEQDNIKTINKAFYQAFLYSRNVRCLEACKKFFGFTPPLDKAFLVFQICTFIETKGDSHQSKNRNILINSANQILKEYRNLKETWDWGFYYSSLLCLNFGAPTMRETAAEYCLASAGFGYSPALCLLAEFYQKGEAGFPQDEKLMQKYFMLAINKGSIAAKRKLGILYTNQKKNEGIKFLEDAAKANDVESLIILGNLHKDEKLVHSSERAAVSYFDRAIALGSSKAADILAKAFSSSHGKIIKKDDEKAKTYRIKYYEIEVNAENGVAARELALLYIENNEKDKGLYFLKLAMEFKDGIGALELARLYYKKGEDKDKIISCYRAAYTFLSKAVRTFEIDTILTNCKSDGLWLISQGELKLGSQFLTEITTYLSTHYPDTNSNFNYNGPM